MSKGELTRRAGDTIQDALKFPLIGSAVLVGLFCLFKFLPKDLVNAVLTAYFVLLGTFAITAATLPMVEAVLPRKLRTRSFELKKFSIPYICKVCSLRNIKTPK